MDPSTISIQHKRNPREEDGKAIWRDMHGWMEQRQREWDDEMAQLKSEFFSSSSSLKTPAPSSAAGAGAAAAGLDGRASRRDSDDASVQQDRMSLGGSSSGGGGGVRGLGDVTRGRTFRVSFDVSQFKADEVNVRTQENCLVVYAKHEEQHEKKSISREFNRRVDIPSNIDPQSLQCFIRDDGTLLVESSELPSEGYDSSSCNRDSPSPMGNSSAHSVFSDRLSDGDTCSPSRTDREDTYSPPSSTDYWSSYRASRREPDRQQHSSPPPTPHGIDRNDLTPQGMVDTDHNASYSWPGLNSEDLDVLRRETAQRPIEYVSGAESELRNRPVDDPFNYERRLGRVGVVQDTAFQSHRAAAYPSDSFPGSYTQNTLDRGPLPGQQWSHHLPKENGGDPGAFTVVVDVGTDFEPHELAVKTVDDKLVVYALRRDPYTGIPICEDLYREFDLPYGVEPETITANLTPEGVLIIEAPRNAWSHTSRSSHPSGDSYFYDS